MLKYVADLLGRLKDTSVFILPCFRNNNISTHRRCSVESGFSFFIVNLYYIFDIKFTKSCFSLSIPKYIFSGRSRMGDHFSNLPLRRIPQTIVEGDRGFEVYSCFFLLIMIKGTFTT